MQVELLEPADYIMKIMLMRMGPAAVAAGMVEEQVTHLDKLLVVVLVILVAFPMVPQLMVYNQDMERL
jgi:hypothetical protein